MAQRKNNNRSGNKSYHKDRNRNGGDNRNRNDNRNQGNNRNYNKQNNRSSSPKEAPPKRSEAQKPAIQTTSKAESSNDLLYFVIFLVGLAVFFLARKYYIQPRQNQLYGTVTAPKFRKEGKLTFLDAQSEMPIIGIDIEIADSPYQTERGLMHRRSLPANGGMLFIFPDEYYRTFWMKDTYLSLDIIFLNEDKEIIRISKNTQPLSERSIPSGGKAMYVVEVLAGFTDAYKIHLGDHIEFTKI
ncbi:MAG: DUF192 domain-containing protein [Bacteroidota bacterium]